LVDSIAGLRFLDLLVLEEMEEDALVGISLEGAIGFWSGGGVVGVELVLQEAILWVGDWEFRHLHCGYHISVGNLGKLG
jgi:hypothetical protein